jgi:hypothetical protein
MTRVDVNKLQTPTDGPEIFCRRDLLLLVLVLALAAGIRLVFSVGLFSSDEANYLRNAAAWWTGRFDMRDALFLHDTRPVMFAPVAWSFAAFGVSEATALLWPFVASLVVVACVYLTTLRLFGRETAVYAAFFAAFLPLLVEESTRLLPGVVMNMMIALCALFFVVSEQVGRGRWLWLALSGVAYGALQIAGELGIVLGCLFLAAVIVWRRYSVWTYWPAVLGVVGISVVVGVYFWAGTGDPLFKIGLSKRLIVQIKEAAPHQPLYYVKVFVVPWIGHGGIFYLTGIGCIAGLVARRREALFVALWIALTWALIEFGSVSLSEYRQLSKEVRCLSVVSVPSVILAGYGMAWIRQTLSRRRWSRGEGIPVGSVIIVSLLIAIGSVWTLDTRKGRLSESRVGVRKVRDHVRRYDGRPIYITHWLWNTEVGFSLGFDEAYYPSGYAPYHVVNLATADSTSLNRYVQTLRPGETIGPGLLIHDERLFQASRGEWRTGSVGLGEIPDVLVDIPGQWRLIERIPVNFKYTPALYEIPEGATWPTAEAP